METQPPLSPADHRPEAFFFGFGPWRRYLEIWFPDLACHQIDRQIPFLLFHLVWAPRIRRANGPAVYVWGFKYPRFLKDFCEKHAIPLMHVEDGFIRSIQLGVRMTPPASLTIDSRTMHYDAGRPSDLELMLSSYDFAADGPLMARAGRCLDLLLQSRISKYNLGHHASLDNLVGPKVRRRILVVGQVEHDASIAYGCANRRITNNDVVRLAREENPAAQIIYRPHPESLQKVCVDRSDPADVADIADILTQNIAAADVLGAVDHVYTITSLMGFEAVIRGLEVTTVGCPFYSGWGLTDDRQESGRRGRRLGRLELFAAAYLLYSRYYNPETGRPCEIEEAIDVLLSQKGGVRRKTPQPQEAAPAGA